MIDLGITSTLILAGFTLDDDLGYWSLRDGDIELALQPQILNAGQFQLQLYRNHMPLLDGEVLVDVKPRPRAER